MTKCDCTIYPFAPEPPCYDICIANHLALARKVELQRLGVSADLAGAIERIPRARRPRTLAAYSRTFSRAAFERLKLEVGAINPEEFVWLREQIEARGDNVNDPWAEEQPTLRART